MEENVNTILNMVVNGDNGCFRENDTGSWVVG